MSVSMPGSGDIHDGGDWVMVQGGEENIPDGENGSIKIDLPINTMDNEVFVIEEVDMYQPDQRMDADEERTHQQALSTYADADAIAAEGPTDLEAGFRGESILWLYGHYFHAIQYSGGGGSFVDEQVFDPFKGDAKLAYPFGHLYCNYENLEDPGQLSMGAAWSISGRVVEVDSDELTRLLREVPDPRNV